MERRFVALMAMDVVGYSRQMRADEEGTLTRLARARDRVDRHIAGHGGRIFNTAGDSVLAEFPSPVSAVRCALDIQQGNPQDSGTPQDQPLQWRIGVHIGEVIDRGGDLFGDGVNITARLEGLAPSGGVCISAAVHEQVGHRLEDAFHELGARTVKNIDRPVHVFAWSPDGSAPTTDPVREAPEPTIAVLPFENLSGDGSQDFLADGVSEEIITTLSKVPGLRVVARHSTFIYKTRDSTDIAQVGRDQNATHVLEGSLRSAGNRVRITAQLVDAASGHHVWAERYDRELDDIFDLQDEIALRIATALQGEMIEGEMARLRGAGTRDIRAWEAHVRANFTMRGVSRDGNRQARQLVEQALARDPDYAAAHASLALTHAMDARHGFSPDRGASVALARAAAQRALDIDPHCAEAWGILGFADNIAGQLDDAVAKFRTALDLNPNHAEVAMRLALALIFSGRPDEALRVADRGMTLCPQYPPWFAGLYGFAQRAAGHLAASIPYFREYGAKVPGFGHVDLVIVYTQLGDAESARAEAAKLLEHRPDFTISNWAKTQLYSDPALGQPDLDALRAAGLPE